VYKKGNHSFDLLVAIHGADMYITKDQKIWELLEDDKCPETVL
jgi:hypothetical protein